MPEIVDIDELVPDDITFKYRGQQYTIPGDLKTGQTLDLYALLERLADAEAKGTAAELKRIMGKVEQALLPIFRVHQPQMEELPFGAAGIGVVLRRVLQLIGLLQAEVEAGGGPPPNRAARRARKPRSTRTQTKPGSTGRATSKRARPSGGSSRSKSS